MGSGKELLVLGVFCLLWTFSSACDPGQSRLDEGCVDTDECEDAPNRCGENAGCLNTHGSYYCQCLDGYEHTKGKVNFTDGQCQDKNECLHDKNICGANAICNNSIGSYNCSCNKGYSNSTGEGCKDIDECAEAKNERKDICGLQGSCNNTEGSYWCVCERGFTNYGKEKMRCSELNCDGFNGASKPAQSSGVLADIRSMMRSSCLALSDPSASTALKPDGNTLFEKVSTAAVEYLTSGKLEETKDVTNLLSTVEDSLLFIGPQLKENRTKMQTSETEAEIAVERGETRPTGPIQLTNENAALHTDWTTVSGDGPHPGFALAALLSYKNLESSVNRSFDELTGHERDGVDPSFQVYSKVASIVVSNPSTKNLSRGAINITMKHLEDLEESPEVSYICAYWSDKGAWSTDGCYEQHSNATHTVCTCEHLSSFAVLMALYPMEHTFGLQLVTKIGLSLSLVCLFLCILTFKFCRSIQGTRCTIHLHLCICLFMADLIFLAGISQTKPVGGCRLVAALLHFFFLGVMSWMLLEGVQLYRMVVMVFNATIRPLYLYVGGYGAPLAIVIISGIIRPKGYGTSQYCWLSLDDGLVWSFYGPVCFIIVLNVFFFIVTVWKLAQKFTSLNPDLSKLHKIKAFTVTAIAQMCILGLMWVFGVFLFQEVPDAVAYIFTILNSMQGALLFIMHCLLSKQVREEYAHFLSCICTQPKKRYSDLSSTNPSSSQSQGTKSGGPTGESQI